VTMSTERIQELIEKYNAQQADPAEMKLIEKLIEEGLIDIAELHGLQEMEDQLVRMETPTPSMKLDDTFYHMVAEEKRKGLGFSWKTFFAWPEFAPRLAFASVTLLLGLAAGFFLRAPQSQKDDQIKMLGEEVSDLKEMMMLSLLEKESATDRLKAVSLSEDMGQASQKVTTALLQTLNHDDNVNVRLAALDALRAYSKDSKVREELIRSISKQDSPLVQISLAELMVEMQAKSSVKELEKILRNENTPTDVKKKIRESIQVII
jgi:hypothetical protein